MVKLSSMRTELLEYNITTNSFLFCDAAADASVTLIHALPILGPVSGLRHLLLTRWVGRVETDLFVRGSTERPFHSEIRVLDPSFPPCSLHCFMKGKETMPMKRQVRITMHILTVLTDRFGIYLVRRQNWHSFYFPSLLVYLLRARGETALDNCCSFNSDLS